MVSEALHPRKERDKDVTENPREGGGKIIFRGVIGVVRKYWESLFVFYCIFMWQFFGPYPLPS